MADQATPKIDHTKFSPSPCIDESRSSRLISLMLIALVHRKDGFSRGEVEELLYPNRGEEALRKSFRRDLDTLAELGINIEYRLKKQRYYIREKHSQPTWDLTVEEGAWLFYLLEPLVQDETLSFRPLLQSALTKVHKGLFASAKDLEQDRILTTINEQFLLERGAEIHYTRADGKKINRMIAIFGTFSLNRQIYIVADEIGPKGLMKDVKTYRLSRFTNVVAKNELSYKIPENFSIDHYRRLPFMIGDATIPVSFAFHTHNESLARQVEANCEHLAGDAYQCLASDLKLAARWCIANDALPLAPDELRKHYSDILNAATQMSVQPKISEKRLLPLQFEKRQGRPSEDLELQRLFKLILSLHGAQPTLTVNDIRLGLGVDRQKAEELLDLLLTLSYNEGETLLNVSYFDEDEKNWGISLLDLTGLEQSIHLTPYERFALLLGIMACSPAPTQKIYKTIVRKLSRESELAVHYMERISTNTVNIDLILEIKNAIAADKCLKFNYYKTIDAEPDKRRVIPTNVLVREGVQYLECYDLDAQDRRLFRLDKIRMLTQYRLVNYPDMTNLRPVRHMKFLIKDEAVYQSFNWNEAVLYKVKRSRDQRRMVDIPYWGSEFIKRQLIAMAGCIDIYDEDIKKDLENYARGLIEDIKTKMPISYLS